MTNLFAEAWDLGRCYWRSHRRVVRWEFTARLSHEVGEVDGVAAPRAGQGRPVEQEAGGRNPLQFHCLVAQQAKQYPGRSLCVPLAPGQEVQILALVVDRAPKISRLAAGPAHKLIAIQAGRGGSTAADGPGSLGRSCAGGSIHQTGSRHGLTQRRHRPVRPRGDAIRVGTEDQDTPANCRRSEAFTGDQEARPAHDIRAGEPTTESLGRAEGRNPPLPTLTTLPIKRCPHRILLVFA